MELNILIYLLVGYICSDLLFGGSSLIPFLDIFCSMTGLRFLLEILRFLLTLENDLQHCQVSWIKLFKIRWSIWAEYSCLLCKVPWVQVEKYWYEENIHLNIWRLETVWNRQFSSVFGLYFDFVTWLQTKPMLLFLLIFN